MVLGLISISCSSSVPRNLLQPVTQDLQAFQQGLEYMDKGAYKQAAKAFEALQVANPHSQVDILTLYNAGSAYEGLKNCKKAIEYFKKTVHHAATNKMSQIEAQALLRLSHAYECLGRDDKVIATLETLRGKKQLKFPREVIAAEIPARIGGAYTRLGDKGLGDEFFKEAERGLQLLRDEKKDVYQQRDLLAKALFLMGQIHINQLPVKYLRSLNRQQVYLLKSVELESQKWSTVSMVQLINIYDHLWNSIKSKKWPAYRLTIAKMGLYHIKELRNQKFQTNRKSKKISKLFIILKQHEENFTYYLDQHQKSIHQ